MLYLMKKLSNEEETFDCTRKTNQNSTNNERLYELNFGFINRGLVVSHQNFRRMDKTLAKYSLTSLPRNFDIYRIAEIL